MAHAVGACRFFSYLIIAAALVAAFIAGQLWPRAPCPVVHEASRTLAPAVAPAAWPPWPAPAARRPPPAPRVELAGDRPVPCIVLKSVEGDAGDQALAILNVVATAYLHNMGFDLTPALKQHGEAWLQSSFLAGLLGARRAEHLCEPPSRTIAVKRLQPIPLNIDPTRSVELTGSLVHYGNIAAAAAYLASLVDAAAPHAEQLAAFDARFPGRNLVIAYRPYYEQRTPQYGSTYGFYGRAIRRALDMDATPFAAVHVFIMGKITRPDFVAWLKQSVPGNLTVVQHQVDGLQDTAEGSLALRLMQSRGTDFILCNSTLHAAAALLAPPHVRIIFDGRSGSEHVAAEAPASWLKLGLPALQRTPPPLREPPCSAGKFAKRTAANPFTGRIIHSITFNGEADMLEAQVYEILDLVDLYIVVEGAFTNQGEPKQQTFPAIYRERLSAFPLGEKIIFADGSNVDWAACKAQLPPPGVETPGRFACENALRQSVFHWIPGGLKREDLFVMTDVDLIADRNVFQIFRKCDVGTNQFIRLRPPTSHYSLHFVAPNWLHSITVVPAGLFMDRLNLDVNAYVNGAQRALELEMSPFEQGYHLSWFGTPQAILKKVKTFSESQLNRPPINTLEYIVDHANRGVELLERGDILTMNYRPFHQIVGPWFVLANIDLRPNFVLYDQPRDP